MERDDIYEYSLDTHHDEAHGKAVRKQIYLVTLILSVITFAEVMMGMYVKNDGSPTWLSVKTLFILLTVVKAGYIVMIFMHMKDEHAHFKKLILYTYYIFIIYLTILCLNEGFAVGHAFTEYGAR
jgi:cytochrome c oxidase subunit IV